MLSVVKLSVVAQGNDKVSLGDYSNMQIEIN